MSEIFPSSNELELSGSPPLRRVATALKSVYFWSVICLLFAGVYAWADRHSMNPDGLSYLDMGSESLKSGPSSLVNGYWSPLYPALIGLTFAVVRPSLSAEFPVVHLVNFLIFCVALLCFGFFIKSWTGVQQNRGASEHNEIPADIRLFYLLIFFWCTVEFTRPSMETPDMCVTALVFLAAGMCCRICSLGFRWRHALILGTVLGLGYYAKASMFPIGLALLALLLVLPPPGRSARLKVALACLTFFIVAAPLVSLVSKKVGHLSTGEAGPLAYALYVNGLPPYPAWNPGPLAGHEVLYGIPEHRLPTILYKPIVLDFAVPAQGTNSLSYNRAYWFAGAKSRFDPWQQWAAVKMNCRFFHSVSLRMVPLLSGAVVLWIIGLPGNLRCRPHNSSVWLTMWPLAASGIYALVHVEERFLPGFLVLFWLALYDVLWQQVNESIRRGVLWTVLFTLLIPTAADITRVLKTSIQNFNEKPDHVLVGNALKSYGVLEGNFLAVAGGFVYGVGGRNVRVSSAFTAYYARYIGARVVAAIVDRDDGIDVPQRPSPEFWNLNAEELRQAKEVLAGIGVKAIVALDRPADSTSADWKQVVGTPYSILLLNTSDATHGSLR